MEITITKLFDVDVPILGTESGYTLKRLSDNEIVGPVITLFYDYSKGVTNETIEYYYEEIKITDNNENT